MRNATFIIFTCIVCLGCGSSRYGYSETAWTGLGQGEREAVQEQALDRKQALREEYRERKFFNKTHNIYLGSRANEY